ncbi:Toll/interleukin-1 receptor domain-containing protein, partial [Tanacetum coccineum]
FTCFYKEDPAASSFGNLEKLISIGLCSCTNLESFSRSIHSLQCLEKLTLEGSIPEVYKDFQQLLEGFPVGIFELKSLKYFHLLNCTLDDLPEELRHLNLLQLGSTLNLKMLILEGCNDLVDLHLQAESLNLEYLDLSRSKLKTIQLGNDPNLNMLILKGSNDLLDLHMQAESLNLEYLDLSHSKLKTIQLGNTPNLEKLLLIGCKDVIELQMPAESLKLAVLHSSHSKLRKLHLRNTPNLEELILEGCNDLVEFQMPE